MAEFGFSVFLLLTCTCVNLYVSSASVSENEIFSKSINEFGSDLMSGLFKDTPAENNILVSPVNVYAALALLHLGAGNKTLKELESVMKIPEKHDNVHETLQALFSQIAQKSSDPFMSIRKFYDTTLANGIFVQEDFPIKDSYKFLASNYYESEARNVDFAKKAAESTDIINKWISKSTKGRIAKFYESPLESDTISVLISTLYFIGKWKTTFSEKYTQNDKFRTGGKVEIETPMMFMNSSLEYETNNDLHYDSVTLPYAGKGYEMTIYLQHEQHGDHGSLANLYHKLAQKNFPSENRVESTVLLKLPKMKFSWKQSLVQALKLEKIFAEADLSAMTTLPVRVSNMIHATDLEVDEKGTVATAATAIEMVLYSLPEKPKNEPIKFYVNRPFLMTINHITTKTVLFAGIVRNPM